MHDVAIIGAGPAGITAAVYAARKRLDVVIITKDIGGQTAWSGDIENYTGYQFVSGPELVGKFEDHLKNHNVKLTEGQEVLSIDVDGNVFNIYSDKSKYTARSVIIASGKRSKELGVPGEKEFRNKGLTYCATCDGPLFSGKDVAVIGGGNSALDAGLQMVKIARHVYLLNNSNDLTGDKIMQDRLKMNKNLTVVNDASCGSIMGDKMVNGLTYKVIGDENHKKIDVQGVFVEIGLIPNSGFKIDIQKNKNKEIVVDAYNRTNIKGIFAAGDVTNVPEKQIIIAAGEGAKAAIQAFKYVTLN